MNLYKEFAQLLSETGMKGSIHESTTAQEILENFPDGSRILTFNYDTGERYLSVNDLF